MHLLCLRHWQLGSSPLSRWGHSFYSLFNMEPTSVPSQPQSVCTRPQVDVDSVGALAE